MKYLKKFENFDPKLNKLVSDYVDQNKFNLPDLWDKELSEDENIENMLKYFTEYPNEIKSGVSLNKIKVSQNKSNSLTDYAPMFKNIIS